MAKTVVIFSTKGGVGKTLIAANLAVSLGRDLMKRVCLIDLDLQAAGDMARLLDLNPQKTMVDFINVLKKKPENIKKDDFLVKSPLGISFLPAVLKPQQSPHLEPNHIKEVFSLLDKDYEFLIVDAGKSFSDIFVAT